VLDGRRHENGSPTARHRFSRPANHPSMRSGGTRFTLSYATIEDLLRRNVARTSPMNPVRRLVAQKVRAAGLRRGRYGVGGAAFDRLLAPGRGGCWPIGRARGGMVPCGRAVDRPRAREFWDTCWCKSAGGKRNGPRPSGSCAQKLRLEEPGFTPEKKVIVTTPSGSLWCGRSVKAWTFRRGQRARSAARIMG